METASTIQSGCYSRRGLTLDGNYGLDLKAIMHHVQTVDTVSIFFPIFRRSLVVDLRCGSDQRPLVAVMPMVRSAADRVRSIKRMRPNLPRPNEIVAIPWPAYVDSLVETGVWGGLTKRLAQVGTEESLIMANEALTALRHCERREIAALIKGEQYQTIWATPD